jgi:hypothetical protein
MRYVERRNVDAHDFYTADFIRNGKWHILDLSKIPNLPANALLHIRYEHKASVDDVLVKYRNADEQGEYNNCPNKSAVKNVWHYETDWIVCNHEKKIAYKVPPTVVGNTFMVVGWWEI